MTIKDQKKINEIIQVLANEADKQNYIFYIRHEKKEILLTPEEPSIDWLVSNSILSAKIVVEHFVSNYEKDTGKLVAVPIPASPTPAMPIDPDKYYIRLRSLDMNFFSAIFSQLSDSDTKEFFVKIFLPELGTPYQIENRLTNINNGEYINVVLKTYLEKEQRSSYSDGMFADYIDIFSNRPGYVADAAVFKAICKNHKYILKDIKNQSLLKNFVENKLPDNLDDFRTFWKKVDTDNINKEDAVTEYGAHVISYNKVFLHNINPSNPDEEFCLRKIKVLVAFLNKEANKKILDIDRIVIDGANEGSEKYNFIVLGMKNFEKKELLKNLINKVAELDIDTSSKSIQNLINYEVLNSKVKDEPKKSHRTLKI